MAIGRARIWTTLMGASAALALSGCSTTSGMGGGTAPARMDMSQPSLQGQPGIPFSGRPVEADNQAVIDALMALGLRPYHTLTPQQARLQPSFADGVKEVLRRQGRPATPPPGVSTQDISVGGAAGPIHARVYRPDGVAGPLPVIVYYHGGGWVIADSNVYDASTRALAREAQAIVISVDYRLAPENKFPAQHDDALAAYRWATTNATTLGGDPNRIAIAGESAGGNLAIATAVAARDAGLPAPVHILSIYPIGAADLNTPSYRENANAMPLNRAAMAWFLHHTTRVPADAMDPRISLAMANLRRLPPVTIIQAEIDPLRSDGDLLITRLRSAGVPVQSRLYTGVTHEFFGADAVIAKAKEAQAFAGERLRAAFRR